MKYFLTSDSQSFQRVFPFEDYGVFDKVTFVDYLHKNLLNANVFTFIAPDIRRRLNEVSN